MLIQAFHYKTWADHRTLEAVAQIDAHRFPEQLAFTLQQLNHMAIVEELFRARLSGTAEPHRTTNTTVVPGYEALKRRLLASGKWYSDEVGALNANTAQETIRFTFTDGRTGQPSRQEVFFHILNHATYHRGSIARALDQAEVAHPADTYTVFVHTAEPARRESN
jgi:uncharacterized damage-inducible protein DinB